MWSLVVADDEPKIRRGIEKILNWQEYNVEIVGEAEDGEIALEVIIEKNPDIIFLDINMPFLNGLNLLGKLREVNNSSIVIIISGYDDFQYAQKALRYNVFDYILKPVNRKNIEEIVKRAVCKLIENQKANDYLEWVKSQVYENIDTLKNNFFSECLNNKLSDKSITTGMEFFNIKFEKRIGIIVIKLLEKLNIKIIDKKWNKELLDFAIINLLNDKFKEVNDKSIFIDESENIVLICSVDDILKWQKIGGTLEEDIRNYLKCDVIVGQGNVHDGILKVKDQYLKIIDNLNVKKKHNPVVLMVIKYIEKNYYYNELSINVISDKLEVTASYLSKLLKKETGLSFIDYLTNIRIKKAMYLMEDPTIRIYDVAELVGYSNQHYFCRAFKKLVGVSPTEYKRRK